MPQERQQILLSLEVGSPARPEDHLGRISKLLNQGLTGQVEGILSYRTYLSSFLRLWRVFCFVKLDAFADGAENQFFSLSVGQWVGESVFRFIGVTGLFVDRVDKGVATVCAGEKFVLHEDIVQKNSRHGGGKRVKIVRSVRGSDRSWCAFSGHGRSWF